MLNAKKITMSYQIAIVLAFVWISGILTSYTFGGWIHLLIVLAVLMVIFRAIRRGGVF